MTHITCRLSAKNRDQLRNPTLGNRVWATFTLVEFPVIVVVYVAASSVNKDECISAVQLSLVRVL